jgi:hypothetical protein
MPLFACKLTLFAPRGPTRIRLAWGRFRWVLRTISESRSDGQAVWHRAKAGRLDPPQGFLTRLVWHGRLSSPLVAAVLALGRTSALAGALCLPHLLPGGGRPPAASSRSEVDRGPTVSPDRLLATFVRDDVLAARNHPSDQGARWVSISGRMRPSTQDDSVWIDSPIRNRARLETVLDASVAAAGRRSKLARAVGRCLQSRDRSGDTRLL